MSFGDLPLSAQFYIAGSSILGAALLSASLSTISQCQGMTLALLIVASILLSLPRVAVFVKHGRISLGNTVAYLAIILCSGWAAPAIVAAISGLAGTVFIKRRTTWYKPVLSASNLVLSALVGTALWHIVWGTRPIGLINTRFLAAALLTAAAYFFVNTVGISLAVSLSQRLSLGKVWQENFLWSFPGNLCAMSAAAATALLYQKIGLASFLALPPVYIIFCSYRLYIDKIQGDARHIRELNDLNVQVIGTLAMTIEAKDRYTHKHVERVREYALAIAAELGITGPDLEAIRIGSMVHDIGKIAVPEAILAKPGKLTSEEFERMKSHVLVGVKILEMVSFPFPVTDAVAAHHEQWDGGGYPNGLKGEEIPLVGRVVALADCFDALTSDRPYRTRMTDEEAMDLIQSQSGTHYDPRVVEALIRARPRVKPIIEELDRQQFRQDALSGQRLQVVEETLEQIARAAEESIALAEMATTSKASHTSEEVVQLLLEKAIRLLPATTAAVFLKNPETGEIEAQACQGLYTHLVQGLTMKVGEGISGWVAAEGVSAKNQPAGGDLSRRIKPGQYLELNSALSAPLATGDRRIGAITLYHTGYNIYVDHHERLLTTLAEHAAGALDTINRLEANQVLANTDGLTGLPNMRYLVHYLEKLIGSHPAPFSLFFLDLNGFKQVNDTRGHMEGDRVLQEVAEILRRSTRGDDIVGRYAGDEFVVICHHCAADATSKVMERIRAGFLTHVWSDSADTQISASVGAATFPIEGEDWKELLSAADLKMYRQKLEHYRPHALTHYDRLSA